MTILSLAISSSILRLSAGGPLKVRDLVYASEDRLEQVVGRRTSGVKDFGVTFAHEGYNAVHVDGAGSGMRHLTLQLGKLSSWRAFLGEVGLDTSHAKATPSSVAASPIPLLRNKMVITDVGGIPTNSAHKPWNVTFVEYATANKDRLRAMRSQILSAPVGDVRNKLIRSCYDWGAELDFSSP